MIPLTLVRRIGPFVRLFIFTCRGERSMKWVEELHGHAWTECRKWKKEKDKSI